ncbi:MAG: hypothetical protein IME96_08975 [Proteobacteria bacterium]|nr:hypothetical protein [Pseudomonadota bacterium]
MKKALLIMAVLTFGFASIAAAEATVAKDFGCFLASADSGLSASLFTDDTTHYTEAESGNVILQCHFDIPEGFEPDHTLRTNGFVCGTYAGATTDTKSIATKGGKAHLRCIIH